MVDIAFGLKLQKTKKQEYEKTLLLSIPLLPTGCTLGTQLPNVL